MIADIRLQQYRSYLDKTFSLSPGLNIVVGPNASGKTNLLEAIMVISSGKSYRAPDSDLIMHNKDWARIDATTESGTRVLKLSKQRQEKEFLINDKAYKRLNTNQQIPIVLFEPNHLLMLSGSPELRRGYLDGILDLIKPGYKKTRNAYIKTLRQRNALLKSGSSSTAELFPWNVRLSHLGGVIAASRHELVNELNSNINQAYTNISKGKESITLNYKATVSLNNYESQLLNILDQTMDLDLLRGFTANGPHREDVEILIDDKPPSSVASRGEARTITIVLKTVESEIIEDILNVKPVILLDDVFSELDKSRTKQLEAFLIRYQSIITTTDTHLFVESKQNVINT